MGICCSKKSPSIKSDPPIQKNKDLKPKIDKNPENKTVLREKAIIKHRKNIEIDRQFDERLSKPIQKNSNTNPKIDKTPEDKTEIEEKPILKRRKRTKTHFPIDEKNPKPTLNKLNSNLNSEIDKNPDEKTENKEKPFIKHRKSNEIDRHLVEEAPELDKKHISLITNEKTENKEKPFIKHRKSSENERKSSENIPKPEKITVSLTTNNIEDCDLVTNGDEVDAILIQCGRLSRCSSENADVATTRRRSPNGRRTPGRESGRRVSRSPGKRSEEETTMTCRDPIGRPGKMVSVPATDKEGGAKRGRSRSPITRGNISKVSGEIHGKSGDFGRNLRKAERSPYRRNPLGEIDQNTSVNNSQPQYIVIINEFRGNSRVSGEIYGGNGDCSRNLRKAERSPYRRNPLGEIDQNTSVNNSQSQKRSVDSAKNSRTKTKQQPTQAEKHAKAPSQTTTTDKVNVVTSGPQVLTRTRSSRLSQDLDNLNLDAQNTTSYTALLLEDIQSFHNKNPVPIPLPQCLSKTCSILDQIADLNSNKGTEGLTMEKYAKKLSDNKEPPLLETEVVGMNDLLEPSFQKYRVDEGEESTGSNIPQHWISSSLWETNSIDSNSSMKSSTRDSKSTTKGDVRKKREIDCHKMGIGQGKAGLRSGIHLRSAISTATI